MIVVSNDWKNLHEQPLLPETFIEIRLDVSSLDVSDLVTTSATNQATFSNTNSIINNETPYDGKGTALLEYNLWTLDGSKNVISDLNAYKAPGFVSKNDESCVLNISLSEIQSSETPGIRIFWSGEHGDYATDFTVAVKQGDNLIDSVSVTGNSSNISQVEINISDFDRVVITVTGWSVPDHRMRIDGVNFGSAIVFDKNQILSYTHEQTGDPLGSEISKNTIEFSVDNTEGRWDLLNPKSMEKYLYERQPVIVRYGMQTGYGVEWFKAGVFYLTEWRAPSNGFEATFVARDAFDFMLNTPYSRPSHTGVVVKPTNTNSSMTDSGLLVFSTIEGTNKASGTVVATLPVGTEVSVYEMSAYYSSENADPINGASYYVYRIDQGWVHAECVNITSETSVLAEISKAVEFVSSGKSLPCVYGSDLENTTGPISVQETNVAEFIQKCVNKCGYTMWQKADGKIYFDRPIRNLSDYVISKATAFSHPEVELTKPLKQVSVVSHNQYTSDTSTKSYEVASEGEVITLDNPYLWGFETTRIDNRAKDYIDWWSQRGWVSGDFRADPRLELFDVVTVESKYGLITPVMITQIKYTYGGSFHGTYKGKILSETNSEVTEG